MGNMCVTSKSYIDERNENISNDFKPFKIKEPEPLLNIIRRNSTPFH